MMFRDLVQKSGKSRAQLIQEIGCSQSYLSLLESGERRVGPLLLKRAASALGVEPHVLRPDLASIFPGNTASEREAS